MSSTKYLTSNDLKLLDGVLAAAGMHDQHADPAKRLMRRKAAKYLISRFQEGARSSEALARELHERPRDLPVERQILSGGSFVNYQYGKRVEPDRSWTVIHVFTGRAARAGSWIMRGLSKEGAERLLGTMNCAPATNV
jgi:hypothetical protein